MVADFQPISEKAAIGQGAREATPYRGDAANEDGLWDTCCQVVLGQKSRAGCHMGAGSGSPIRWRRLSRRLCFLREYFYREVWQVSSMFETVHRNLAGHVLASRQTMEIP